MRIDALKSLKSLFAAWALVACASAPLSGQSKGPTHPGYDPNANMDGHYHVGELGAKSLIIEQDLRCNCGCGLDVHQCQFQMQCGTSPVWAERIRDALARGESVETIEAGFVADFGEAVLMAPPPEGFNLVGYLLPGVAIVVAGTLVGLLARGGTHRERLAPVERVSADDEARLRRALRKLDKEESPDW